MPRGPNINSNCAGRHQCIRSCANRSMLPHIVYRLTGHGMAVNLWGDPKTGQPIRMGLNWLSAPGLGETTVSDFAFDMDLDESLFSLKPPPGYKVQREE